MDLAGHGEGLSERHTGPGDQPGHTQNFGHKPMGRAEYVLRRARVPLGFAFAAAFLIFARPSIASLARSLALVVPGLLLRGYAAGYVKKNSELTTTGPYARTRNPLYLGSFLAALGFVAASRSAVLVAVFVVLFFAIYLPVIRSEEGFLRGVFPAFDAYLRQVPRLFPSFRVSRRAQGGDGAGSFSVALYRRHREYNASIGAAAVAGALLLLLWLRHHGILPA